MINFLVQNSAESFKVAMDLWKQLKEAGHDPRMRATCFAAALAINQNAPHIALEILSVIQQQNYVSVRNLKVICPNKKYDSYILAIPVIFI